MARSSTSVIQRTPSRRARRGAASTRIVKDSSPSAAEKIRTSSLGVASPVEPASEKPRSVRSRSKHRALDDTVRETIKRRWKSERPFVGATTDAIVKKLQAGALTPKATEQARRELVRRSQGFRPV